MATKVKWDGNLNLDGYKLLAEEGAVIVSPTKVGYIIMATDKKGLERKFDAKERNLNKPGVVLCASIEQLKQLAELNAEIERFYQYHWDNDILLGCILPWRNGAIEKYVPNDGSASLMMDRRKTSCFVVKYGTPSEQIAQKLWESQSRLVFASSANPSGKGNRGVIEGVGQRIEESVDLLIEADDYVRSIQPDKTADNRYEQGVMVSMVDESGHLIPEQRGEVAIEPAPVIIRKGLDVDKIMYALSNHFISWNYRQGTYY